MAKAISSRPSRFPIVQEISGKAINLQKLATKRPLRCFPILLKRKPAPAVISANGNPAPDNRFSVFSIATGAIQPFKLITTASTVETMKGFFNSCLSRWLSPFFDYYQNELRLKH